MLQTELEAALGRCFDAMVGQDSWPLATEAIADTLGALGSCFHMFGAGDRRLEAPMSIRYREMLGEFLAGGWAEHDVRGQRGWPLAKRAPQVVILENDVSTPEERARLPIYTELFRRHDLETFAGLTFRANGRLWAFNIVRSQALGDYGGDTAQQLTRLGPHLSRLICFGEVMSQSAALGAMTTLERSTTGAILLDWSGKVFDLNRAARSMMGSGLSVHGGRVCADSPAAQAALDALIAGAVQESGHLRSGLGPVAVPKRSGGALLLDAVTTGRRMGDAFARYGALLLVTDPGRRSPVSRTLLRRLYGLTPREAEVAERVGVGESAAEIAEGLGLKSSSVRQLIKAVLEKTGAKRQSELAALISRLPVYRDNEP